MQFSLFTITTLLASAGISLAAPAPAPLEARATLTVKWDARYDNKNGAMTSVSCSDGRNGLITKKKWNKFGQVTNSPFIGGWEGISGWNSAKCGQCLQLSYKGKSYKFTAIDRAAGITISKEAMNRMTGGQAEKLGKISVDVREIKC